MLIRRLPLVYALLSVKWCQIILNIFLAKTGIRRIGIFNTQLKKAKKKLNEARIELNNLVFPLSLVKEPVYG